ncbi:lysophospholipid acyltransferase family protein [Euzebya tangerina]|uniref:lysophospholipid acyltransferase family protein n=1 Tax=Euzebya tangerina TaxID=591198 RepID=UPI001F0C50EA|nr:lysophospholipid acyltransferase family protein [Euzebya tangerina]
MAADEKMPLLYRTIHTVLPPVLTALYRPTVEGLEHIPTDGPAILASNHLSFLDHFFLPAYINRPIFFLGKSDYFRGWQRYFFENVGVKPIDREGGDAGERSLRTGQRILDEGKLLGIYPEGTRSPDGRLYRGKTGPVRLALRAGVPILPVAMLGVFDILPPGRSVPRVTGKVGVKIGRPLDFSRYEGQEDNKFALRSATDELMYELMLLSGQEYVDEYAAQVKAGEVDIGSGDLVELGRIVDEEHRAA